MEERNANNPGGIDMGPHRIVHPDMNGKHNYRDTLSI